MEPARASHCRDGRRNDVGLRPHRIGVRLRCAVQPVEVGHFDNVVIDDHELAEAGARKEGAVALPVSPAPTTATRSPLSWSMSAGPKARTWRAKAALPEPDAAAYEFGSARR